MRSAFLLASLLTVCARRVSGAAADRQWMTAPVGQFTIYTDCPVGEIAPTAAYLSQLLEVFHHFWPVPQTQARRRPILIFVQSASEFMDLNPELDPFTSSTWGHESLVGPVPVLMCNPHLQVMTHWSRRDPVTGRDYAYSPVLYAILQQFCVDQYLKRVGERTPAWLEWGLQKLLNGACLMPGFVEIPALTTDPTLAARAGESDAGLAECLHAGRFYSLSQLFTNEAPQIDTFNWFVVDSDWIALAEKYRDRHGRVQLRQLVLLDGTQRPFWATSPFGPFVDEAYEFLHLCLVGAPGPFRNPLWRFGQGAANGPADESLFKDCFGLSYAAMLQRLWRYTGAGKDQRMRWNPAGSNPAAAFQPAAPSKVKSLLGSWLAAATAEKTVSK